MAFLLYFVVILVSAASVLFGLDLMTSPLPSTPPNVPIGRSAHVAPAHVAKPVREAKREADTRTLSPVYPTHPDAPPAQRSQAQTQPQTDGSAGRSAAGAQNQPTPDRPPQQPASSAPAQQQSPSAPAAKAKKSAPQPAVDQTAAPQPAVAQSKGHCDIQACAAAYHSFRASDCSYQSYRGARQVCTRSGTVASAERAISAARRVQPPPPAREASDSHELDEVTRIVRKMTRGREGDVAVQDSRGRIIIVRPADARASVDDFRD